MCLNYSILTSQAIKTISCIVFIILSLFLNSSGTKIAQLSAVLKHNEPHAHKKMQAYQMQARIYGKPNMLSHTQNDAYAHTKNAHRDILKYKKEENVTIIIMQ